MNASRMTGTHEIQHGQRRISSLLTVTDANKAYDRAEFLFAKGFLRTDAVDLYAKY